MGDSSNSFESSLMGLFSVLQQSQQTEGAPMFHQQIPSSPPPEFLRMMNNLGGASTTSTAAAGPPPDFLRMMNNLGGASTTSTTAAGPPPDFLRMMNNLGGASTRTGPSPEFLRRMMTEIEPSTDQGMPPFPFFAPTFHSINRNGNREIHIEISVQRMEGPMEAFFTEMLRHLNPDNDSTSKKAIEEFEKVIIIGDTDHNGNCYSVKKLKKFLDALSIDHSEFLEKKEFVDALFEKVSFKPLSDCFTDNSPTCTICACDIKEDDLLIKLPCGHWFHFNHHQENTSSNSIDDDECPGVTKWLSKNSTCPNCKASLPKQSDVVSHEQSPPSTTAQVAPGIVAAAAEEVEVTQDSTPLEKTQEVGEEPENSHEKPSLSLNPPENKRQRSS